jgi:aryl-alcohol dehydrogenase-like predicted oxidoreductase
MMMMVTYLEPNKVDVSKLYRRGTYMISKASFGRTGHLSSRLIFGGWALSQATQKEADGVLDLLLQYGVNHIDVARMYGDAEERIGSWMQHHRHQFFLATKTRKRTYRGAIGDLHKSLKLLGVDYIDLWQMHGLTGAKGWEVAMGPGGCLEAFIKARDRGLVRFLGVTGHGTRAADMHTSSLERFDFDSVLLPYNYSQIQLTRYASAFARLLSICHQRNVAVQTIKSIARRSWEDRPKTYHTYFYEPLDTQEAIDKAVQWAMGLPGCFVISAGDMKLLPRVLQAASRFKQRPSDSEMKSLMTDYDVQPIFKG